MPSRLYTKKLQVGPRSVLLESKNEVWYHSPRINGKLMLRSNQHSRQNWRLVARRTFGNDSAAQAIVDGSPGYIYFNAAINRVWSRLEAETYSRLRSRLYKGSAALGVTLGEWRSSREMITSRYRQMTLQASSFEQHARRVLFLRGRRKRIALDKLGGQYLEMVFGWKPMLTDIYAACRTVVDDRPASFWVRARAQTYFEESKVTTGYPTYQKRSCAGTVRHARVTRVEVTNPNTWLRERAGLNNPAAVAWDLVPWSWVINLFSNVGSLVNSITDFAGLSFPDGVTIKAYELNIDQVVSQDYVSGPYGGSVSYHGSTKLATLGAVSRPPLILRLPNVDWDLAAIAASVFLVQFRKVDRLVNLTFK